MTAAILALALSAPVPVLTPEAIRKELDALWAELAKPEPASTRAVLKFAARQKDATPYFKEKLPPLKITAEKVQKLLADLNAEKAETWRAAVDQLDYFDPRLAVGLEDLMAMPEVQELKPRARLVAVLSGDRKPEALIDSGKPIQLRKHGKPGEDYFNFLQEGSWWAEAKVEKLNEGTWGNRRPAWTRAVRAVAVLEYYATPEAAAVLAQLAEGHPDAQPTKAAKAALKK